MLGSKMKVLGFDVRAEPRAWTRIERKTHLLSPASTQQVLSVDVAVWPPVRDPGYASRFWNLLYDLHDAQSVKNGAPPAARIIAITFTDSSSRFGGFPQAVPKIVQPGWSLLGFDVADTSLISFLTNMTAGKWSKHLQDLGFATKANGLLPDEPSAVRLASVADNWVPTHAPFIGFGIWEVTSV
jgi:hypothetical protein